MSDSETTAAVVSTEICGFDVNEEADGAVLHFEDGSHLQFVHTSRSNRWARPSSDRSLADKCCESMNHFRLNGKHLQLFFEDGSDADFPINVGDGGRK